MKGLPSDITKRDKEVGKKKIDKFVKILENINPEDVGDIYLTFIASDGSIETMESSEDDDFVRKLGAQTYALLDTFFNYRYDEDED